MDAKRCSRCGEVKPVTAFGLSKVNKDGLVGQCRPCRAEKARERRATPEGRERWRAQWTARNKRRSEALAEERKRNPLPLRRPAEGTPEWVASLQRKSWAGRIAVARTQARRFGCEINDLTLQDWTEIVSAHQGQCFYCQATGNMWIEHVRPLHTGAPNSKSNVVPACESCNRRKARRSMEQFLGNRCGRDHLLTPDNLYVYPDGKKWACKTCRLESFRRYRAKKAAAA